MGNFIKKLILLYDDLDNIADLEVLTTPNVKELFLQGPAEQDKWQNLYNTIKRIGLWRIENLGTTNYTKKNDRTVYSTFSNLFIHTLQSYTIKDRKEDLHKLINFRALKKVVFQDKVFREANFYTPPTPRKITALLEKTSTTTSNLKSRYKVFTNISTFICTTRLFITKKMLDIFYANFHN